MMKYALRKKIGRRPPYSHFLKVYSYFPTTQELIEDVKALLAEEFSSEEEPQRNLFVRELPKITIEKEFALFPLKGSRFAGRAFKFKVRKIIEIKHRRKPFFAFWKPKEKERKERWQLIWEDNRVLTATTAVDAFSYSLFL